MDQRVSWPLIQHQSHADFGWSYYGLLMFKETPTA
jgi:hypothetical protein